jgi:translation elongation factor P/translation initiation factor 5A
LLDENDWDARTKRIVFFVPEIASILLDGKPIENREKSQHQFKEIEISGSNLKFSYCKEGTITINDRDIRINLIP